MKKVLRSVILLSAVLAGVGAVPGIDSTASACPGCKNANETDTLRPRAYMYSILFMLGMPATVFAGFGIAFYRLSRRAQFEQMAGDGSSDGLQQQNSDGAGASGLT